MGFEKFVPFLSLIVVLFVAFLLFPIQKAPSNTVFATGKVILPQFSESDLNSVKSSVKSVKLQDNAKSPDFKQDFGPSNLISFSNSGNNFEKNGFFGVGTSLANRISMDSLNGSVEILENANAKWAREEFSWDKIQSAPGFFDFKKADAAMDSYSKHNISVLGLIDYGNSWANSNGEIMALPSDMAAFENYVSAIVERFDGDGNSDAVGSPVIYYWEIWNEENSERFWKPNPNPEEYSKMLISASKAVKSANPNAKIVFGGTAGNDSKFISKVLQTDAKNYVDVIAVHPYSLNSFPEAGFLPESLYSAESFLKNFGNFQIWLTELGWPSNSSDFPLTSELQANYLIRSFVIAFSVKSVEKVFWYDFKNDGPNSALFEDNMGLVEQNLSPKKSLNSFKKLSEILDGSIFLKKVSLQSEPELQIYLFENISKKESYILLWQLNPNFQSKQIELNVSSNDFSSAKTIDLVEVKESPAIFEKKENFSTFNIAVSGSPIAIVLKK